MKYSVLALFMLVIAGVVIAGCTQSPAPAPAAVAVPTSAATQAVIMTTAAQPAFTLGDHFFAKKYSWQAGNEVYTEQFMVSQGTPWGIGFDITALNDDPAKCWFEVTVTDLNNPSNTQSFGWNRGTYPADKSQIHPIYGYGSYKVDTKGNYVKVDMKAAKRNA